MRIVLIVINLLIGVGLKLGESKLTTVHISGEEVNSDVINWEIKENIGNPINEALLEFSKNVNSTVPLVVGQEIEIWEGFGNASGAKVLSGEIINFQPDGAKMNVTAFNALYATVRRTMNAKIYDRNVTGDPINPDGKLSDAFKDIVTTFAKLDADAESVQDSGTGITLTQFVCDHTDPKERMDKLAEALNWHYYYCLSGGGASATGKVNFEPKQFKTNPNILQVGDKVVNVPKWKYDKTDLINDLRLDGLFQEREVSDLGTGDGTENAFSLSATPIGSVAVYVSGSINYASGAMFQSDLQSLGVSGSSVGVFSYTVDKSQNRIVFEDGNEPPSGSPNNILFKYVGNVEIPVHQVDDESIATYGLHARTIQLTDTITVADAETRVGEVLEKFKDPFQSAVLKVRDISGAEYKVGERIEVGDDQNNPTVSGAFTINQIIRSYPGGFDEITVGDREFDPPEFFINQAERIHRLERRSITSGSVLTELRPVVFKLQAEVSGLIITQEYINDTFVMGHPDNSILYDISGAKVIDHMGGSGAWFQSTGSEEIELFSDGHGDHFWVSGAGIRVGWTASSGVGVIDNLENAGNFEFVVSGASGTPVGGTAGLWVHTESGASVSDLKLRLGSSSSDYVEYNAETYAQRSGFEAETFIESGARTYLLFDLNSPDATNGTPNWTAMDFRQVRWQINTASALTFNYMTASRNNNVSLTGLGNRITQKEETVLEF